MKNTKHTSDPDRSDAVMPLYKGHGVSLTRLTDSSAAVKSCLYNCNDSPEIGSEVRGIHT